MEHTKQKIVLRVFFEEPFWIGIFERVSDRKLSVCKFIFGAKPKDSEVYEIILRNYYKLHFSLDIETEIKEAQENPKRIQRSIKKQFQNVCVGTKSQQALKLQHEQMKIERKNINHEKKEIDKQYKFELRKQKRKEKHKGK